MKRRSWAVAALLALAAFGLFGEEGTEAGSQPAGSAATAGASIPRRLYLFVRGRSQLSDRETRVVTESLLASIQRAGGIALIEAKQRLAVPGRNADKTALAQGEGADAWLEIAPAAGGEGASLNAVLFDVREDRLLFERQLPGWTKIGQADEVFWGELVSGLRAALPPREQKVVEQLEVQTRTKVVIVERPRGTEVTFQAAAGTRIAAAGMQPLLIGPEGVATVELPQSATYRFRAALRGFEPALRVVYLDREALTIAFTQKPMSRFKLELSVDFNPLAGFGVLYCVLPSRYFAQARVESSYLLPFPPYWNTESQDWFDRSLLFSMRAGIYLNEADAALRVSLATGPFLRLYLPAGEDIWDLWFHPVFPYGWSVAAAVELLSLKKVHLFLEWGPEIYLKTDFHNEDFFYPGSPYQNLEQNPWSETLLWGSLAIRMGVVRLGARYRL